MSSARIETGIPIPKVRRVGRRTLPDLPFLQMVVGDSFFVAGAKRRTVQAKARAAAADLGWRFVTRDVEENGARGVRCWRKR